MKCPICYSDQYNNYQTVQGFKSYKCLSCKHIYVDKGNFDLQTLYEENFYIHYMSGMGYERAFNIHLKDDFISKINLIKNLIPKGSNILEIGAGPGYFANMLTEEGFVVTAVELSDGAQEYANKNGVNIEILSEDISSPSCSIYDLKYDLVISWAVIEHVENPHEFINLMKRYCKKDGFISVDTGILLDFLTLIDVGYTSWLDPPHHLHVFSKKSLHDLVNKDFQVISYFPHWDMGYQSKFSFKILIFYIKRFVYTMLNLRKAIFKKSVGEYNLRGLIIGKNTY
ncbi:methyltransferase domain-containing protein [Gammaproteobacteria bacterium]|nr:methyltransferase domain-containing protein [Gammaproteobacteria bacterium]